MRNDVINKSRARNKEKIQVPDRNWTYDLPYTGRGGGGSTPGGKGFGPPPPPPDRCTEGRGFNIVPVGDFDFFLVPCSWHIDHIISHFFSEVKLLTTIFLFTGIIQIQSASFRLIAPFVLPWCLHPFKSLFLKPLSLSVTARNPRIG